MSDVVDKNELLFRTLISTFKHHALQGLGKIANQFTGRPDIDLDQAQYAIDTLSMLMQKTNGNLSDREQHELQGVIHTLRINYLDVKREVSQPKQSEKKADVSVIKEEPQEEYVPKETQAEKHKHTPFYRFHKELGAKMVPFAGYEMPVQYEGINQEHVHVRTGVGVFDVSHMGEFLIRGRHAEKFVSFITCNDPRELDAHGVQYSAFVMPNGGIVDDLLVYKRPDGFLLVVNAANIEKDWAWINQCKPGFDVILENKSDETAQLAIQGPLAEPLTEVLTGLKLSEVPYYNSREVKMFDEHVILSRTGYTGEDGFELYFPNEIAETMWTNLFELGKAYDLKPIGLGARDSLRLEMKYCLYGHDIDETTSPLEAGLGWIVKFDKISFLSKDFLIEQKALGLKRKLIALVMKERVIPRQHYKIFSKEGEELGEVTSGILSPSLNIGIAMGYVRSNYSKVGTSLFIEIRNSRYEAEVIKPPFYKQATHR